MRKVSSEWETTRETTDAWTLRRKSIRCCHQSSALHRRTTNVSPSNPPAAPDARVAARAARAFAFAKSPTGPAAPARKKRLSFGGDFVATFDAEKSPIAVRRPPEQQARSRRRSVRLREPRTVIRCDVYSSTPRTWARESFGCNSRGSKSARMAQSRPCRCSRFEAACSSSSVPQASCALLPLREAERWLRCAEAA
jgi:hypothetical protein